MIYTELVKHALNSTEASIESNNLLVYGITIKLGTSTDEVSEEFSSS